MTVASTSLHIVLRLEIVLDSMRGRLNRILACRQEADWKLQRLTFRDAQRPLRITALQQNLRALMNNKGTVKLDGPLPQLLV